MKAFYAEAGAEELRFVLDPTAALVESFSGVRFEPEAGVGHLSRERAYLIAPACAGLNFTIAAFASLLLGFTDRFRSTIGRTGWLAAAAAIAFAVTPVANALRIALDLALRDAGAPAGLARTDLHRAEGVVVYLGVLWLVHLAVARVLSRPTSAPGALLRSLGVYLAVALGVPWLNGAGADPAFAHHAAVVVATAAALAGGVLALRRGVLRGVSGGVSDARHPTSDGSPAPRRGRSPAAGRSSSGRRPARAPT